MNLENVSTIYFVGIGGIAMSAAAGLAKEKGFIVSGSDTASVYSPSKDVLDEHGINYFFGYDAGHVSMSNFDLFVISAGEDVRNPEVAYILDHKLPYISFSELLFELANKNVRVVVTGTHGKSTTAGLLGCALKRIDDSSFLVGAVLQNTNSNYHAGTGHYFVFEGDEYKALFDDPTPKFHFYKPDIAVFTNLEFDHPDMFKDLGELKAEFKQLVENMPEDGLIVYNADDPNLPGIIYGSEIAAVTFGVIEENEADYKAVNIRRRRGFTEFQVAESKHQESLKTYCTSLPGNINVYNALAVIATLRALGFSYEIISPIIEEYRGVKRRFELIGEKNGVIIIDDYAHHPTAIRQTLAAARSQYPKNRIWAVFEPHTFSRTLATLPDLATSFAEADNVLISEIYPARESKKTAGVSSEEVIIEIAKHNHNSRLVKDKTRALQILKAEVQQGDVVIIMAVGNFNRLGYDLLESL